MNKQLSRFYVGAGKASTPTPWASGWLLIRMGLELIGQHIRTQISNLLYSLWGWACALAFGIIGVLTILVLCALFLALCFSTGWIVGLVYDVIVFPVIRLLL